MNEDEEREWKRKQEKYIRWKRCKAKEREEERERKRKRKKRRWTRNRDAAYFGGRIIGTYQKDDDKETYIELDPFRIYK